MYRSSTLSLVVTVAILAICIGLFSISSTAQTFYGSIVGTVADPSGAVVPGALVTLTNLGTSERRTSTTDTGGNYQFVNLVPGRYRIDIESSGFKHLTRDEIVVEVQATVRIDAAMQVGDVGQVVEVQAQTPLLQTETSSLGQVVDSRKVQEMPLNGRNVLNLVALVPGVVPQGNAMSNPTGQNIFAFGNYQIGGGIAGQNAAYIDGAPLNVAQGSLIALIPTQDAMQEFRVQTNNLGPEFGRFTGGVINLTSKSGTNNYHGSAYEFLRNKVLNANTFFNNRSGTGRPAFTQNQYGANLGGPIVKDKTFFFASYEGFRQRQGQSFILSVPTAAMRLGDFSNVRNAAGNLITIYDPLTTCGRPGNPDCAAGQTNLRTPFPGNIIPASRLDPTSRILSKLWADPNTTGQQFTNVNNFSTNASVGGNNDQWNIRGDQNVSDKQRLFARFSYWSNLNLPIDPYRTRICLDRCSETFEVPQAVIGDTYSFGPTTIGDIRLAFVRFSYQRTPESLGVDLTQYGWPSYLNNQVSFRVVPTPVVQGFTDIFSSQGPGSRIIQHNDSFSIYPSLTKIAGRHTLKFGGEIRRQITNYIQSNVGSGIYNFDNLFTAVSPFAPAGTGLGFASFMLGYGASGNVVTPSPYSARNYYAGLYASDSYQITQKLTVNYGLRWELPFPFVERYDRYTVLLLNADSPLAGPTGLPLKGRLGLVNSPEHPSRHSADTHWNLFAPRGGFAYRLTNKTVLRGGYGIFFAQNDGTGGGGLFSLTGLWVPTTDGEVSPANPISNPWPSGILQPPQRNPSYQTALLGSGISAPLAGDQHYPYTQQWNFNVQREIGEGTAIEVAYAGSKGTHLLGGPVLNQLADQYLSLGTRLQQQVPNPFLGLIPSVNGTLGAATVAYGQLLRPYPQYTGVTETNNGNRDTIYHSMAVKVQKRFRSGGTILGAYTWSKFIGNVESGMTWLEYSIAGIQNNNNLKGERSISSFDTPHRLIISYVVDLPFGEGRKWLTGGNGVARKVVSGWGLNGVSTFQSGFPLGFGTSSNLTNSFGGGSRPNVIGGCDKSVPGSSQDRLSKWFNTSCFVAPPAFTFGNESRTDPNLRAHGIANYDFAVFKNTTLTERFGLQFRTEVFNLFNRVQFAPPGLSLGNPQFGVIGGQANNPRLVQFALRLLY